MSVKTRVEKLEDKDGSLVLIVVRPNQTTGEALIKHGAKYGTIPENSRVLFVSTGVPDRDDD